MSRRLFIIWFAVCGFASGATGGTLNTFFVGNSLTSGMSPERLLGDLASPKGDTWGAKKFTRPGAPLDWHWYVNHLRDDLVVPAIDSGTWDAVSLQPFDRPLYDAGAPRSDISLNWGSVNSAGLWIDLFRQNNANAKFYIYASYPQTGGSAEEFDYNAAWDQPYTDVNSFANNFTRSYFNQLTETLRLEKGTTESPIHLVPFGEVLYRINEKARAGAFGGLRDVEDWYRDSTHLAWGLPQYAKAATFYATMFGESPEGLDWSVYGTITSINRPDLTEEQKLSMFIAPDQAMVDLVNETVWEVVSTSTLTGVPEPGSALLMVGLVGSFFLRRRLSN